MKTGYVNDSHAGVKRQTGTTKASQIALRGLIVKSVVGNMQRLISEYGCKQIVVNGDMCDRFNIEQTDQLNLLKGVNSVVETNPDVTFVFSLGNHDLAKDNSIVGSAEAIIDTLMLFHSNVIKVKGKASLLGDQLIIPHMENQDLFDEQLTVAYEGVAAGAVRVVAVHANYDNGFAAESDHSLNVSSEAAEQLTSQGAKLIFGHEHAPRKISNSIFISGVQFPTSISDCRRVYTDFFMTVYDSETKQVEWIPTGKLSELYLEHDWNLPLPEKCPPFVRVVGNATAAQAADVVQQLARFRNTAGDEVIAISNAVRIDQDEGSPDTPSSDSFDVNELIFSMLPDDLIPLARSLL